MNALPDFGAMRWAAWEIPTAAVVALGQDLPRLGFQAPGRDLSVPRLAGELGGGAQVRGSGVVAVQVDQGRGRQQRQPAADDQQAAVLGQGDPAVQQRPDVP
jgi:hypothetical protein